MFLLWNIRIRITNSEITYHFEKENVSAITLQKLNNLRLFKIIQHLRHKRYFIIRHFRTILYLLVTHREYLSFNSKRVDNYAYNFLLVIPLWEEFILVQVLELYLNSVGLFRLVREEREFRKAARKCHENVG